MSRRLRASLARYRGFSRNAWLYLISNNLQAFSAGAIGVLYTLFLNGLGYGLSFISLTLFVGTAGGALAILPASALTRRLGWRTMLLWSDIIGGVAVFFQLVMPTRAITLITSLGLGAAVAIFLVLNSPFLAANSAPDQRNAIFGLNNGLGWLAAVTGSLLGGFLPVWFTSLTAHGAFSALDPYLLSNPQSRVYQLSMLAAGLVAVPSIIPVVMMRERESAHATPPVAGASFAWPLRLSRQGVARWLSGARAVARGAIGRFALSQSLMGFGAGLFFPFLNIYFVEQLHATTAFYGALTSAVTASLALVSLASVPLADRFGRVPLAVVAQLASLPFMVAMGALPVLGVVSVAYILRSALVNVGSAPLQAWLMDAVTPERRVLASNVYNVSWQGAWAIGAALGGTLITLGGYGLPFYVAAALYGMSAVLLARWFLPGRPLAAGERGAPDTPESITETSTMRS